MTQGFTRAPNQAPRCRPRFLACAVFCAVVSLPCLSPLTSVVFSREGGLPKPLGYVSDHAGVLNEEWKARIRSVCKDLERKTGVEMVVVTTRDIAPYTTLNEYADALYKKWGIGTAQQEHGVMVVAGVEQRQATVTLGRNMIGVIPPPLLQEVTKKFVEPAFRLGHFGEGLYRTVVSFASASQAVRVGTPIRRHIEGVGFWLTLFTVVGAFAFFWWISRPDKRHPFRRIQKDEFWGTGQGGFGGNFGGLGGEMSGEGWK